MKYENPNISESTDPNNGIFFTKAIKLEFGLDKMRHLILKRVSGARRFRKTKRHSGANE
jgi:hypothetical protein